jgi:hypothetical protein
MKHTLLFPLLIASTALSQASCGGDPTAPQTSEILPVSVQTRLAIPGEVIPTVRISGGQGNVVIQATTVGVCATVVDAGVSRGPHELSIVSHVSPNPAAICIAMVQPYVADYVGTIGSLAEGSYRVRVFESSFGVKPRLIGSAVVTVSRPTI